MSLQNARIALREISGQVCVAPFMKNLMCSRAAVCAAAAAFTV